MAKTFHLQEVADVGTLATPLRGGSFWEHWFETQATKHAERNLDEHRVWEQAINFGILAIEKAKP